MPNPGWHNEETRNFPGSEFSAHGGRMPLHETCITEAAATQLLDIKAAFQGIFSGAAQRNTSHFL